MVKPVITTRATKGSALTWTEGDTNLENLRDATVSVTDGTNTAALDLNDTLTLTAGSGVSIAVDSATKTATITNTQTAGATTLNGLSDVVITAAATGDILYYNGTNWVDIAASTLSVSSATSSGSATNININTNTGNNNDTALSLVMVAGQTTGNQVPHIDTGLTWDALNNDLTLGASGATNSAGIILYSSGGGTHTIQASTTASALTALTLPSANGAANSILQNNGSGTLSWSTTFGGAFNGTSVNATSITSTGQVTANATGPNVPKLLIGNSALSSTAWTTFGIGLRVSNATYTDTSSAAGTIAASHPHAITAPTIASTNIITVTDAGTLYISGPPTAGTNTTITNGWALLANGRIKATAVDNTPIGSTTASTGAFTTLSASGAITSTVATGTAPFTVASTTKVANLNVEQVDGYHADTANTASTIAVRDANGVLTVSGISATTTATTGAINVTYNPSSASGSAINATGKDSQGGVGYFDFLKITNTTTGATNANKTFRTNSTGQLEIINSAYTGVILALTDAGNLQAQTLSVAKDIRETNYTLTYAATITPDCANGTIQTVTLTGNVTFSAFANPVAGQSMTLIVKQDATGSRTLTSTMKFNGGSKTLSTAANAIDIISVFYDGTNYWASLGKGFA